MFRIRLLTMIACSAFATASDAAGQALAQPLAPRSAAGALRHPAETRSDLAAARGRDGRIYMMGGIGSDPLIDRW